MTVCKIFRHESQEKGKSYRRRDILDAMEGPERMASTYYDPSRDELCTFFDENSSHWINEYRNGMFTFHHRAEKSLTETPAWERTKIRHVFFRRAGQDPGEFEYLGTARDEKRITAANGHEGKQYRIY
jgi:hypothetical protein